MAVSSPVALVVVVVFTFVVFYSLTLWPSSSPLCVLAFRSHVVFLAAVFVLVVVYSLARR